MASPVLNLEETTVQSKGLHYQIFFAMVFITYFYYHFIFVVDVEFSFGILCSFASSYSLNFVSLLTEAY